MSFWDNYTEPTGSFVKADEKQVLMDNGIPFEIVGVLHDETNQYGPRYVATVMLPEQVTEDATAWDELTERSISFPIGNVESRNRMLSQMQAYFAAEGAEPVTVKLEKQGQSILIRKP